MLEPGFVLEGKYEIESVIGRGGMSTVYLARHQRLNQKWAIKEINREYCENYGIISRQLIEEADILKNLNHPGLPKIIDIVEKEDVIWMVMEFIEGITLKEFLRQNKNANEEQILIWGRQLCKVLSYLHSRKPPIIYRDLKPENIILQKNGRLTLIDFGTAREYCYEKNSRDIIYFGTRGYAAPEQYGGMGQTDERTDIYCLGVTLYSLFTGHSLDKSPYKVDPERYWRYDISLELKKVILKCIQPEPERRYQNCEELSYAFSQIECKNKEIHNKEKMRIQQFIFLIIVMQACGILGLGCKIMANYYRGKVVTNYIKAAEKSIDKKEAEQYYKQSLLIMPWEKKIYESLVDYFIRPNDFQIEDATILTNLVMSSIDGKTVIEIFRKYERENYVECCYRIGIGYFFDMGGITGKCAAEVWFHDAIKGIDELGKRKKSSQDKRKRAELYARIGNYYNTFLVHGTDKSGERETKDFQDFYRTLHILNQFKITERSSKSDISAAYLISKEVALEIINYADKFIQNENISKKTLESELEQIKRRIPLIQGKKNEELKGLLEEAKKQLNDQESLKDLGYEESVRDNERD